MPSFFALMYKDNIGQYLLEWWFVFFVTRLNTTHLRAPGILGTTIIEHGSYTQIVVPPLTGGRKQFKYCRTVDGRVGFWAVGRCLFRRKSSRIAWPFRTSLYSYRRGTDLYCRAGQPSISIRQRITN